MNEDQSPPVQSLAPEAVPISASDIHKQNKKKKRLIATTIMLSVLLLLGGATAYYVLIYLPNTPENVFKKAMQSYGNDSKGYSFAGRLDQGGPNDADFDFESISDASGNTETKISARSVVQNPSVTVRSVNGTYYVKFDNFWDSNELRKHYANATGELTLEEYVARFADKSGVTANAGTWLALNDYLLNQPRVKQGTTTALNADSVVLTSNKTDMLDGKKVRKYEVTANKDAVSAFVAILDKQTASGIFSSVFNAYNDKNGPIETLKFSVWVDTKTKVVEKIAYNGRPFKDATLNFTVAKKSPAAIAAPQDAPKITRTLGYGIVWEELFTKKLQQGDSEGDRERIADLKGIKTALEIYKAKNGVYPDRYAMAVNQPQLLGGLMDGVDFQVFKDPNGRFIGLNGSQYAYVSQDKDGSELCGPLNGGPCAKFFIVTTLDDGSEYQLNSD